MLKRRAAATRGSHSARHPNGAVCSTGWNPAGTQYRCGHRGMERPTHPTPRQVLRSTCTVCDALRGGPGGRRGCGRGAHQAAGITSASKYGGSCAAPRAAVPNGRLAFQPRRQSPPARGPRVGQSTRACGALPPPPPRSGTIASASASPMYSSNTPPRPPSPSSSATCAAQSTAVSGWPAALAWSSCGK